MKVQLSKSRKAICRFDTSSSPKYGITRIIWYAAMSRYMLMLHQSSEKTERRDRQREKYTSEWGNEPTHTHTIIQLNTNTNTCVQVKANENQSTITYNEKLQRHTYEHTNYPYFYFSSQRIKTIHQQSIHHFIDNTLDAYNMEGRTCIHKWLTM